MGFGSIFGSGDQAKSLKKAMKIMKQMYDQTRTDVLPWIESGQTATDKLSQLTMQGAPTVEDYEKSPYFDFLKKEGTQNLIAQQSARTGGGGGGAYDKALIQYNQNMATTDFDNYLNRYYQSLQPYQQLSQMGLNAGLNLGQIGGNTASGMAGLQTQVGQAQANQWAGIDNLIGAAIGSGALNSLGTGLSSLFQKNQGGQLSSYQAYPPYPGAGYTTGTR